MAEAFVIDGQVASGSASSIAWDGTLFLVAYDVTLPALSAIRGATVSEDSAVSAPFVVSVPASMPYLTDATVAAPAATWDGTEFVVTWFASGTLAGEIPPAQTISTVRVSSGGSVEAPSADIVQMVSFGECQSALAPPPATSGMPLVALWSMDSGCINTPVFTEPNGAFFSFTSSGITTTPIGSVTPPLPAVTTSAVSVAASSSTALAAWLEQQTQPGGATSLEGAILSPNASQRVDLSGVVPGLSRPGVASDGSDFLIVWQSTPPNGAPQQLRAVRYSPGTGVLDPDEGFVVAQWPGALLLGGVAFGGGQYLVVWSVPGTQTVWATPVATDGTVGAQFIVTSSGAAPAVGTDGNRFLVSFTSTSGSATQLEGAFVNP